MIGDPALHLLWRKKARGALRRQVARLRTPKGLLLAVLGLGMLVLWLGILIASALERSAVDPDEVRASVRVTGAILTVVTLASALTHRGLSMPREEIERLFASPVRRSDLVRYRLVANLGRSALGAIVLGVVFLGRTPEPLFGFPAILLAMVTLPVLGQLAAILFGAFEQRFVERFLRRPAKLVFYVAVPVLGGLVGLFVVGSIGRGLDASLSEEDGPLGAMSAVVQLVQHPWVERLTLPFEPWARAASATSAVEFWPWFAACSVIFVVLYELCARLPIDVRELSLETAANTADRLRRLRRVGGGASAAKASRLGRKLPWTFGRGPGGAVAWRKQAEIVRKARGTLWVSSLVVLVLLLITGTAISGDSDNVRLIQFSVITVLGTLYLCSGLRFDFRDDLDRMATIKAWPISARRLFLATILPEVLFVSLLLGSALVVRAVLSGGWHPSLPVFICFLPPSVFAWLAVDNAVFLVAPVRIVPGQEGALQNAGRALVLLFVRGVVMGIVGGVCVGAVAAMHVLGPRLGLGEMQIWAVGLTIGFVALLSMDAILVLIGGRLLASFDVARDRA